MVTIALIVTLMVWDFCVKLFHIAQFVYFGTKAARSDMINAALYKTRSGISAPRPATFAPIPTKSNSAAKETVVTTER